MGFCGFLFLLTGARKKDKLMRLNCGHRYKMLPAFVYVTLWHQSWLCLNKQLTWGSNSIDCVAPRPPRELPPRHLSQVKPGHRDQQPTGVYSSWVDEKRRLAEAIRLLFETFFPKCSGFCLKSLGEDPVVWLTHVLCGEGPNEHHILSLFLGYLIF